MEVKKTHWLTAFLYLLILAPLFFIIYGYGNTYAVGLPKEHVGEICFAWERKYIPFVPWTILPYWSIDLLYGLSLFLPMTKFALRQHALRLLVATPIAVLFFCLFPLTFTMPRPETSGIWKLLFDYLMGFDKPFNQAPSLHIILLVIIWRIYLPHCNKFMRWVWNMWCLLIGISVLTTYQHHFIDVPLGLAVGVLICYAFPLSKYLQWKWVGVKSCKLGFMHLTGFLITAVVPLLFHSYWLYLLWWPSLFCLLIALGYFGLHNVFQKKENGQCSFAGNIIFYPYRVITKMVRRFYFAACSEKEIVDGVYLGGAQSAKFTECAAVLDLCNEYLRQANDDKNYKSIPVIDLAPTHLEELHQSVLTLDEMRTENKTILVHCALGLSRCVSVVLGWLLYSGKAATVQEAQAYLRQKQYPCALTLKHIELLDAYKNKLKK